MTSPATVYAPYQLDTWLDYRGSELVLADMPRKGHPKDIHPEQKGNEARLSF